MSTESATMRERKPGRRINPAVVVVGVTIGVVYLVVGLVQGAPAAGFGGLGIMLAFTGALVVGSRYSDTIALLGDDARDERHVHIHQRAALYTVNVLAAAIVIGALVDIVQGGDGMPYLWLAAVAVVTYFGLILLLSRRS